MEESKGPQKEIESFSNLGSLGAFAVGFREGITFPPKCFASPSPFFKNFGSSISSLFMMTKFVIFGYTSVFSCVNIASLNPNLLPDVSDFPMNQIVHGQNLEKTYSGNHPVLRNE